MNYQTAINILNNYFSSTSGQEEKETLKKMLAISTGSTSEIIADLLTNEFENGCYYVSSQIDYNPEVYTKGQWIALAKVFARATKKSKTMNEELKVAIQALGGTRALAIMIGAKNFGYSNEENSISFRWASNLNHKVNTLKIIYNAGMDSFSMVFMKIHGTSIKTVEKFQDVHTGELSERFEDFTGLRLQIPTIYVRRA